MVECGHTPAREHVGQCLSALTGCGKVFVRRLKGIKSAWSGSLQWAVSGVGLPCGKARLFRWKMVLRLVSPAWARGRPACRTAWFMRVVISAVATWINHVARIKLLLNDAKHFLRCLNLRVGITVMESCVDALLLSRFHEATSRWPRVAMHRNWYSHSLFLIAESSHGYFFTLNPYSYVNEWAFLKCFFHCKKRVFKKKIRTQVKLLLNWDKLWIAWFKIIV